MAKAKCTVCKKEMEVKNGFTATCSMECAKERNKNQIKYSDWFRILQRDNHKCVYCGASPVTHDTFLQIDHLIPIAVSPDNTIDNLVCSCYECNKGKGSKILSDETLSFYKSIIKNRNKMFTDNEVKKMNKWFAAKYRNRMYGKEKESE